MSKIKITINDIEESLCDLDSEYRESLAKGLVELKYLSDTPLRLFYGTQSQKNEFDSVYNRPLKSKEIKEIISFISQDMKDDFQYGRYINIASDYMSIANDMEKKSKTKER